MTTTPVTSSKPFKVGTTGWTVADLDDPQIERYWERGRYEIIEGVLTEVPPAMFREGEALTNLVFFVKAHMRATKIPGRVAVETEVILTQERIVRADAVLLMPDAVRQQSAAVARTGRRSWRDARLLVPPTLIIESVSPGHEDHDRRLKRQWYAEAKVANYWLLDANERSLNCFVLRGKAYRVAQSGREDDEVKPSLFPGLIIPLAEVWDD